MLDAENFLYWLKKAKKCSNDDNADLRIAVLGSYSIQHFVGVLRAMLNEKGLNVNIYEGHYNGIRMDVMDEESEFYKFNPNVVIMLPYYSDIVNRPVYFSSFDEVYKNVQSNIDYYKILWDKISRLKGCHIFQSNFVLPIEDELGNLASNYIFSSSYFFQLINMELTKCKPNNVTIVDCERLASKIGKDSWFDHSAFFLNKAGFNIQYIGYCVALFVNQILSLKGKSRKCLVLDLDNTIWGGIVGDVGAFGIQIDPNNAVGEAYRAFQNYILKLKARGVILAVCSKNDEEIAKSPFLENDNMILGMDDISCFVANWEDKASNINRIANELNIGTDSLVFFDDNPAEREIVKKFLPEVEVIEVPEDPADYVSAMESVNPFDWIQLTKEDLSRSESYIQNHKRQEMQNICVDYDEYLKALQMSCCIRNVEGNDIDRFTQLINKSNQFNLRTKRYSQADIDAMVNSEDYLCFSVELKDVFTNFGIISCVIIKKDADVCFIDTWVMSCRVLKRGVEHFVFNKIVEYVRSINRKILIGEYIPTKKNALVKDLLPSLGFEFAKDEDGIVTYKMDVDSYKSISNFIQIIN